MEIRELTQLWKRRRAQQLTTEAAEKACAYVDRWVRRWGRRPVESVTARDVESYRMQRAETVGAASLNKERSEMRQFFSFAVDLKLRADDPTHVWKRQREEVQREYVVLSRDKEEALVDALEDDLLERFVRFAVATGLRSGTIRLLTWDMLDGNVLEIPGAIMKMRRALRLPLSKKAREAMGRSGRGLVFDLPTSRTVRARIKKAAVSVGCPALSPHDFRRTWVARMAEAGAGMLDVMYLGGWTQPNDLLRHYFSLPEARARELLEAV